VQLVCKISNLCDPDPPTFHTDGQTDGVWKKHFSSCTFLTYIRLTTLNVNFTCEFYSLQIPFPPNSIPSNISFRCRFKFIFPCIFRSLQIPHFAKNDHFPSIFLSLQIHFLAKMQSEATHPTICTIWTFQVVKLLRAGSSNFGSQNVLGEMSEGAGKLSSGQSGDTNSL